MTSDKNVNKNVNENNVTVNVAAPAAPTVVNSVSVNTPNSRGAGTVLFFVFFWPLLLLWWPLLAALWLLWLPVAGIVTIFTPGFFTRTWFYPLPAWLFGIR